MWARVTELLFGVWLLASPWVFQHAGEAGGLLLFDIGTGLVLIAVAMHSFVRPLQRYHAIVLVVGVWLIGAAFLSGPHPVSPAHQNHIIVGFILLMLGIVPNQATRPPQKWREFHHRRLSTGEPASRIGRDPGRRREQVHQDDDGALPAR